jgi:Fe-S cluster assembly protein SufD
LHSNSKRKAMTGLKTNAGVEMEIKSKFIENFANKFDTHLEASNLPDEIARFKAKAFERVLAEQLPTPKMEAWKYANLAFLNKYNFELAALPTLDCKTVDKFTFQGLKANVLVFNNGKFCKEFSIIIDDGLEIGTLTQSLNNGFAGNIKFELSDDVFTNLNSAFFEDITFIRIKKHAVVEHPVHLLQIFDGNLSQTSIFPRTYISIEENSQSKFIETYQKIGEFDTFSASFTEIRIAPSARFDFIRTQILPDNHILIGRTNVEQDRNSVFNDITFTLDGKFVRNNLNTKFVGEYAETHYYGFYFADKSNYIDNHTFMDHSLPNCFSNEIYKGIIGDSATAVFNGKILVRPDAQKTNAYQSNKNILLSDNATINAKPELEIYADDVKCSHGATSGTLDEEQLFYLRARGISYENARNLLLAAFGEEIIEKIEIPQVQTMLSELFESKLAGKLQ